MAPYATIFVYYKIHQINTNNFPIILDQNLPHAFPINSVLKFKSNPRYS